MANRAAQLDAETKQRHPQATVTRRGRNFIEHDLGGGVTRWTGTIEPLHTRAGAAIDTTWVADASPWSYRVSAADYTSRIKASFSSAPLLQYTDVETGATVSLQPMALNWTNDINQIQQISAVQGVTAQLSDDLVRWPGAYGADRDFEYQNHPKRLIKRLVLQSVLPAPAAYILNGGNAVLQFQFIFSWTGATIWIDGAEWDGKTAKTTANRIEFRVGDAPVYWFDAPTAYDANGEAAAGVVLRVRKAGNNLYVEVRTPYTWLQSAAYPVVVDPTLTAQPDGTAGKDTYFSDQNAEIKTYNFGALDYIRLRPTGSSPGTFVLIEFDCSSIDASNVCDVATLYLYHHTQGTASSASINIYSLASGNAAWVEGSRNGALAGTGEPCWNALAADGSGGVTTAWAGSAGCATSGTDYEASSIGSLTINRSDAVGTEYSTGLTTSRVANWFGASNTNYGMLLRSQSGNADYVCASEHATAGYRPKLVVDYSEAASGNPWYAYAQQ